MHLLEHHVSEWVDMYNAGFGVMGEQGTEAIYTTISISCTGHMANKVQRLKCIMQEHYLSQAEVFAARKPKKTQRIVCDFFSTCKCVSISI